MSVKIIGVPIRFGYDTDLPVLPPNYRYRIRPREWVLAIAPDKRRYYVSNERLYLQVVSPVMCYGIDSHHTIGLPQKQLT